MGGPLHRCQQVHPERTTAMMMLTIRRSDGDQALRRKEKKEKKKRKRKKKVLCSCCSVCLWVLFCDELTVVFCSFVRSFYTNSYAFKGAGWGGSVCAGFCFLFLVYPHRGGARKAPAPHEEEAKERFADDGKEKIWREKKRKIKTEQQLFFLFFLSFFIYVGSRKIQIFMVNGSSRDLFKMHCA